MQLMVPLLDAFGKVLLACCKIQKSRLENVFRNRFLVEMIENDRNILRQIHLKNSTYRVVKKSKCLNFNNIGVSIIKKYREK